MPFSDKCKHQVIHFNYLIAMRYLCPRVTSTLWMGTKVWRCTIFPGAFHSLTCAVKDGNVVRGLALFWFQVHSQNHLELVVVTSRVICFKFPNPPLSVHCLCAQIPRKQTVHTHLAHEKETLEDFQVKHHKIHVLAVVSLRVQLLKLQSSGPNKIVFLKRNPTHT